ncbi:MULTISPECIES: cytochrome P450 [Pantoea]|nr:MULTISPECIES: cytochrome P450 [Pantoea]MCL9647269.1 cytochrome P450 [Pantoea eucrina]MDJ0024009.1 cytochrome P450 [Pantoea eucrina]UBB12748.1 cytochrome P450 [Pantoea eucrina]
MAEPFSPPGGLHPHQQRCAQQEIVGDNALPQYENSENVSLCCSDLHA